jgi:hypothetical protein
MLQDTMSLLLHRPIADDAASHAADFIAGIAVGVVSWDEMDYYNHSHNYIADGFVYFAVIGEPYITHVKIGYTKGDPEKRVRSLQTGCPFPIKLLGYVFGNVHREQELHDVMRNERVFGEWFEYTDFVQKVINGELSEEPA